MTKLTRLFRFTDKKVATISRFNDYIRVLDGDKVEHFFHNYSRALAFLLNDGYLIEFIDNNEATRDLLASFKKEV